MHLFSFDLAAGFAGKLARVGDPPGLERKKLIVQR